MNNLFTYRHQFEGKVGIGKLINEMQPILDDISIKYIELVPDKSKTTYHTYYTDLDDSLKPSFDIIQYHNFWNGVCDNTQNCIMQPVIEMNEIYYSNPKPKFQNMNLYGAAANLIPHHDCVLYNFNGINFYRVIIGLTDNNNDTITEFMNINLEHKINKGDYMIFDFDKTLHQVKKIGFTEVSRILLKLHFIVCENCKYSKDYVNFISFFYKFYYYVARYTEQLGTDPETFIGFFFGLLWEWPFYSSFKYIVLALFANNMIMLRAFYEIKHGGKLIGYSLTNLLCIYLIIVLCYYVNHRFTIYLSYMNLLYHLH